MKRNAVLVGIMMVLVVGGVSCLKTPDAVYNEAVSQAQSLVAQGQPERAADLLRKLYDNTRFQPYRPNLLGMMIHCQLRAWRLDAAQALFREAAGRDLALAGSAFGLIENWMLEQGQSYEAAEWCAAIQTYHFSPAIILRLADLHFKALDGAGSAGRIPEVMTGYFGRLDEAAALDMAVRQFGFMLGAGRQADAAAIRGAVGEGLKETATREGVLANMDIDLLLAANSREAADGHLRKVLGKIPDDSAVRNLNLVWGAVMKAGEHGAADALAKFVLETVKGREAIRATAMGLWIDTARIRESTGLISERLLAAREMGFSAEFILGQTDRVYETLLGKGRKEDLAPVYGLIESLYVAESDQERKRRAACTLLDLGFFLEKFEDSLKLVEAGADGSSLERKAMMIAKIKGHLALQKGQTAAAVEQFRVFMGYIAKGPEMEVDPVANTRVSREMILGLNARRIGDILAGAGNPGEAATCYKEARAYYQKSLEAFPGETSKERAQVLKLISELPGT
jgi:tetratricopeptide (TPR) repeat protein